MLDELQIVISQICPSSFGAGAAKGMAPRAGVTKWHPESETLKSWLPEPDPPNGLIILIIFAVFSYKYLLSY